jgi:hypothetical protein
MSVVAHDSLCNEDQSASISRLATISRINSDNNSIERQQSIPEEHLLRELNSMQNMLLECDKNKNVPQFNNFFGMQP